MFSSLWNALEKECWAWWCIAFSADDGVCILFDQVPIITKFWDRIGHLGPSSWRWDNEKEVEISSLSLLVKNFVQYHDLAGRALWGWCGFFKIHYWTLLVLHTHPMWIFSSSITLQWFIGRCHVKCWKSVVYTCCLRTIARYFRGSPFLCLTSFEKRCHKISLLLYCFYCTAFLEQEQLE